jgi:hypothetical protein
VPLDDGPASSTSIAVPRARIETLAGKPMNE